jgi:hypothetical protein
MRRSLAFPPGTRKGEAANDYELIAHTNGSTPSDSNAPRQILSVSQTRLKPLWLAGLKPFLPNRVKASWGEIALWQAVDTRNLPACAAGVQGSLRSWRRTPRCYLEANRRATMIVAHVRPDVAIRRPFAAQFS